ncbi:MAG: hypothetical protein ACRCXL_15110 [Dermatophilaceae bacterium]
MRSPSSLVFIVLVGVWAVYFLQHWVRRRDHIATARSVGQFSAAMRVLERRDRQVEPDAAGAAPSSSSGSSVRPKAVDHHAQPHRAASLLRPPALHPPRRQPEPMAAEPMAAPPGGADDAGRVAGSAPTPGPAPGRVDAAPVAAPAASRRDPVAARVDAVRAAVAVARPAARLAATHAALRDGGNVRPPDSRFGAAPYRPADPRPAAAARSVRDRQRTESGPARATASGPRPDRRTRAAVFLSAALVAGVLLACAGFSLVSGWWSVVAVAVVVAAFAWVRAAVRAEQAARASTRRAAAEARRRRATHRHRTAVAARGQSVGVGRVESSRPTTTRRAAETAGPGRGARTAHPAGAAGHTDVQHEAPVAAASADSAAGLAAPASSVPPEPLGRPAVDAAQPAEGAVPEAAVTEQAAAEVEMMHLVDEDDIPLTWDPVPVPRPTYTMKAKAERDSAPDVVGADPVTATNEQISQRKQRAAGA